ncbi:RidA family protein [Yoonia sediminilitoris]|uniref:Enamine deaminase RidA (YjgF/YER057c/UK114 family) n=1 Tax=Yoonia sediminilitoris TaxID=1286148 RepID=A0A2T6KMD2_9RHOB|nr:RidA family protein [Yoonia sediminilitoris]PUB17317.1 enamine deaminase RidA (YjgF/YER057c/UK114 family) [Yoonia sediminilitoris]RCW97612.1 enamine deaminase RidA (YjgF/YER057c/UK114 family) [Yoonia sediminilitoris]
MTSQVEQRLAALGLALPPDWTPRGQFLPFRKDGNTVYLSGQICEWAGAVTHAGPVADTPEGIQSGREAAQICALNLLYRLREACHGDLDRVDVVLRLGGFVNCQSGFGASPAVINGATELFIALFGASGWHARTAVGVPGLPGNASVEVDAIVRLKD